jgi:hypothetical protein
MHRIELEPFVRLIDEFVRGLHSAAAFEVRYLSRFKGDNTAWTEAEFKILDGLFADVDAFCVNPDLRDEDDIDEDTLRSRAAVALGRLKGA